VSAIDRALHGTGRLSANNRLQDFAPKSGSKRGAELKFPLNVVFEVHFQVPKNSQFLSP
jgi:hypothetical protein